MNKLSTEILTAIFNHLHYTQKLQCKLVCRKWAIVLHSGSDIESVAIPFKWDYLTKSCVSLPLIEKVQDGLLHGENCRRLILYDYSDRALLAKLFPNLKLVFFQKDHPSKESPEFTSIQIGYLQNWHKTLETFLDSGCDGMALNILGSGLFQKLSTIELANSLSRTVNMTTLADRLKNAPNLKKLHLRDLEVGTADLEKLHSNVPCLESLVLHWCQIETHGEQPKVIQPAKSVKELALVECLYTAEFSLTLCQYITCTYSSLERFSLITDYRDSGILEEEERKNAIHYTIRKLMHNLRVLKSDVICTDTKSIMELASNAPFLEVLSIDVGDEEDLLAPILASDTLTSTLRSLSLYNISFFNCKILDQFNRFSHLKKLSLNFKNSEEIDQTFKLDTIINCLPESLDTLKLNVTTLDLSPTHMNDNNISHIRSLTIKDSTIKSDLSGYLSRCFPKLKSLVIFCCNTKFNFELPNHHLSFVEFYLGQNIVTTLVKDEKGKDKIKYVTRYFKLTTTGDVSTFYEPKPKTTAHFRINEFVDGKFFDKHDSLQYNICKPSTKYREKERLHYFHFRCASVQTLLLNLKLIL